MYFRLLFVISNYFEYFKNNLDVICSSPIARKNTPFGSTFFSVTHAVSHIAFGDAIMRRGRFFRVRRTRNSVVKTRDEYFK